MSKKSGGYIGGVWDSGKGPEQTEAGYMMCRGYGKILHTRLRARRTFMFLPQQEGPDQEVPHTGDKGMGN